MKKVFKLLLLSLGSLVLIGGIAGAVYGSSKTVRNWVDEKIRGDEEKSSLPTYSEKDFDNKQDTEKEKEDDSSSSSSTTPSDENHGSSENPGNNENPEQSEQPNNNQETEYDDENCEITLSKSLIYLSDPNNGLAESEEISASITGNPSSRKLVWYPKNNTDLFASKVIANDNEAITITSNFFTGSRYMEVCLVSNEDIKATVEVRYVNDVKSRLRIGPFGVLNSDQDTFLAQCSANSIGGAQSCDYLDHNGLYFHCDRISRSNLYLCDSAQDAMTSSYCIEACASQGASLGIRFKTDVVTKNAKPVFDPQYAIAETWEDAIVPEYTTINCDPSTFVTRYIYDNVNSHWLVSYTFKLPSNFDGNTGYICFKYRDKYYAVHLNAYTAVSSTSVDLDETSINLGE